MHQLHWDSARELIADNHSRDISQQHAQRRTHNYEDRGRVVRRERQRGKLSLVPHLCQEKGNKRGAKNAEVARDLRFVVLDLVGGSASR